MGEASLGTTSQKAPLEDIEAANILLLLWERAVARTKRMQTHASFITHNAPHAAAHAPFLHNQQHIVPFQHPAPDFPALPPHYYYSGVPPQPCAFPQPMFTYYGFMAPHTPPCYVGPDRADAETTPLPPPPPLVAFKDNRTSESRELDVKDRTRPSREQTLEPGARRKRPLRRDSSEKPDAKRRRKNLTKEQVRVLEEMYFLTKYPQVEERTKLQGPTKLSEARIQVWFQNRRAKERREVETKMADQHQGADEKDSSIKILALKDDKDNSQESTENEAAETAGNRNEDGLGQNNVLASYTEEKDPGNVETSAQ